jgi:hypothetical protein
MTAANIFPKDPPVQIMQTQEAQLLYRSRPTLHVDHALASCHQQVLFDTLKKITHTSQLVSESNVLAGATADQRSPPVRSFVRHAAVFIATPDAFFAP